MKYRNSARALALVLAGMLACPAVSAQAATFADMNNVPWPGAEKSIQKAADLKLVVGETINGKSYFKPKDPVSLTQSCQLAYKLLLETGKAKADAEITKKWSIVMDTYKIQSWAHPSVSFCLENGIVEIAELSSFVNGEVNISATREQAATILGRALEVGMPDLKASTSTTIFKDNSSISATARPYVALLNSKKIVNGDDVGKFNPKSTLNRTETAVMVTNLYEVLKAAPAEKPAAPTSASGKVKEMNNLYVNLENSSNYYLFAPSGAAATLNGAESKVSDIVTLFKDGKTIQVTLTFDSSSRITKMEATTDSASSSTSAVTKESSGILTKVRYDEYEDTGSIDINKKSTFQVDGSLITITINNEEYDLDDLYELWVDCDEDDKIITVDLTLDKNNKVKKIVGKVKDSDGKSEGDVSGDLTDISYDDEDIEGRIEIDDDDKYDYDKDTVLEIDGKKAKWEDLVDLFEDGEDLEVILILHEKDPDLATDVEIYTEDYDGPFSSSSSSSDDDEGKIEKVTFDSEDYEGKITVDGTEYDAYDTDDVDIDIVDGDGEITTWEELYNAFKDKKVMEVELEVDDDEVLEITGYVSEAKGYLTDFDNKYLKLKGKFSSATEKYYFTEYDRTDEDEEEDWLDDAERIKMTGVRNISTLFDLYDLWLDDPETNLKQDKFDMILTLDEDGFITKIEAELE